MSDSSARFAVLTGPIASGKSTIGRLAVLGTGFPFIPEDVDSDPADREILADYYGAVHRFETLTAEGLRIESAALASARAVIFRTQEHFIRRRASHLRTCAIEGRGGLVERHPSDDIEIFSRRNLAKGLLTREQFASLGRLMDSELSEVPSPLLTIFLHANPRHLRERIRQRGRPQEAGLVHPENPYLEELDELYERWHERCPGEKARIETDALSEEAVVVAVRRELSARRVFGPVADSTEPSAARRDGPPGT